MIKWLVNALAAPLVRLGERYIDAQNDRDRLRAGVQQAALRTDAAVRRIKLGYLLGRLPLFLAEVSAAVYFAAIMIDSTFPMEWLTPLELPKWFQPYFWAAMASIFGLSIIDRRWNKK